jgi:8-oxo-dGTP diphosphatase
MKEATVCIVRRGEPPSEVLLGCKQYGFGQGKYGGFGGKIEPGETAVTAAVRELAEEASLTALAADLELVARLIFVFPHKPEWDHLVHAFLVHRWQGYPVASAEMIPAWFPLNAIPHHLMWDDSRYWLPLILAGQRLDGHFTFRADNATVERAVLELWPDTKLKG